MECGAVWSRNMDNEERRYKKIWPFWNVDLEKNGESQLNRTIILLSWTLIRFDMRDDYGSHLYINHKEHSV